MLRVLTPVYKLDDQYSLSSNDQPFEVMLDLLQRGAADLSYETTDLEHSLTLFTHMPEATVIYLNYEGIPVGLLACIVNSFGLGHKGKIAAELLFWVEKEHRNKHSHMLIQAFEEWARLKGCTQAALSHQSQTPLAPYYSKLGYEQFEITYIKDIS